jgi:hypothetical protein
MSGKTQISPQSWERMRRDYLTGNVTLKELSELYGVGYSTVRRYASANSWFVRKQSQRLLIQAEVRNHFSQKLLGEADALRQTAGYCIPMSMERHYVLLIKLLELQAKMKLKQSTPLEESPQPSNIIPLRQSHRPSTTRLRRSHL